MFINRMDAGQRLAKKLLKYKGEDVVILAIPRGGLPVAAIVASALNAPLNVVLSKKIGHPLNKEYAIGAVGLENVIINTKELQKPSYISEETNRIRNVLGTLYNQYYKNVPFLPIFNKTVIIIDDGIATGNTMALTIELVKKQHPHSIIVAIPVAPQGAIEMLTERGKVLEVVCLEIPPNFHAVGQFYENFDSVTDEEAIKILERVSDN